MSGPKCLHECVPNEAKADPDVWHAMLPTMGLGALVRQLGKLTSVGVIKPFCPIMLGVAKRLTDVDAIKRARLHPLALLIAEKTYAQGHGDKGKLSWSPVSTIVDALDAAFYRAFAAIEPSNKRTLLALDVSGSMGGGGVGGTSITPREAAAAMALVTAATEPVYQVVAFQERITKLNITPRMRLDAVVRETSSLDFGRTDCAQPMLHALRERLEVDTFIVYTDSETWTGNIHPTKALQEYRRLTGIPAKLIVVGMVSNGFSIADPNDGGMLDVVGFDAATPAVMADFAR